MAQDKKVKGAEATTTPVKKVDNKKLGLGARIGKWFREMRSELKKVVWPTPKQVVNNTAVALVVMVASAIVIWGFDSLASAAIRALISVVG